MLLSGVEKQMFLSNIMDNMDMSIWIKDSNNNLVYINNKAMKLLFGDINIEDITKEKCPLSCNVSKLLLEKQNIIEKIEKENGDIIWLECKKIPILETGGMIVLSENITKKVEEDIKVINILNDKVDNWKNKRNKSMEKSNKEMSKIKKTLRDIRNNRKYE